MATFIPPQVNKHEAAIINIVAALFVAVLTTRNKNK